MPTSRLKILIFALIFLGFFLAACEPEEKEESKMPMTWQDKLMQELPALGHRNWVVVADAAFPLQISPGMEVVVSREDHFAVIEKVLDAVDKSKHIRPKIYLDQELEFVSEDLAPGIEACRKKLNDMLRGQDVKPVLHEELIARMDQVAKVFKILMIKTELTLPYTSVFMELDCGYWSPESEAKMREKMK